MSSRASWRNVGRPAFKYPLSIEISRLEAHVPLGTRVGTGQGDLARFRCSLAGTSQSASSTLKRNHCIWKPRCLSATESYEPTITRVKESGRLSAGSNLSSRRTVPTSRCGGRPSRLRAEAGRCFRLRWENITDGALEVFRSKATRRVPASWRVLAIFEMRKTLASEWVSLPPRRAVTSKALLEETTQGGAGTEQRTAIRELRPSAHAPTSVGKVHGSVHTDQAGRACRFEHHHAITST